MTQGISRRDLLALALASPLVTLKMKGPAPAAGGGGLSLDRIRKSPGRVVPADGTAAPDTLVLTRTWEGPRCRSRLANRGSQAARIQEVVLFDVAHDLPGETALYGEGFQMLSQTGGTLATPQDLGDYTDPKHYKLPQVAGARVVYGLATLAPPGGGHHLLAFTSCRRFSGQFAVRPASFQVVVDTEGLALGPGQEWELEEFTYGAGPDREALLADLAEGIARHHPRLAFPAPPSGWCSWYCFGPKVTAQQVLDNLAVIAKAVPGLKYIQIDDGYQPAMGDWLDTGAAFGGNVQGVLKQIRAAGFEPAIWVAPFVAEKDSQLFQRHPDWFVKDADGAPLRADKVTFGGWRRGPWYALDGTHPEAQKHLEMVFRTMREEWGCTYFKLDANFWGAIHGGRFHDPSATRVEAYRRGMEAVRRGSREAFLLGCNHPIWASLGLVHGSRSSNDIKRTWKRVAGTGQQNLLRNWQNGRLWWNDPDVVVLTGGELTEEEFRFHAAVIYATGGMLLAGDDLTQLPADKMALLRKLQPPTGVAARFPEGTLSVGSIDLPDRRVVCLLNWDDVPRALSFTLPRPHRVRDFWTGEDLGRREGTFTPAALPPHSGRLLVCQAEA